MHLPSPKLVKACDTIAELPYSELERFTHHMLAEYEAGTGKPSGVNTINLMRCIVWSALDISGKR